MKKNIISVVFLYLVFYLVFKRFNEPKKTISAWTDGPEIHYIVTIY
jgi:hypothetical protein